MSQLSLAFTGLGAAGAAGSYAPVLSAVTDPGSLASRADGTCRALSLWGPLWPRRERKVEAAAPLPVMSGWAMQPAL